MAESLGMVMIRMMDEGDVVGGWPMPDENDDGGGDRGEGGEGDEASGN